MAKQYLHVVLTAIRACNELYVLRWLGKEGGGLGGGGGGDHENSHHQRGGSLECYILYGEIR